MADQETRNAKRYLYHYLPQSVVNRLEEAEQDNKRVTVSDRHHQVGLLYSDIRSFTTISAKLQPGQVMEMLNQLFSAFDRLTQRHGVFKL